MSRITFGGGGTCLAPTFGLALKLMKKVPSGDNVFILVSDGIA